MSIFAVHLKIRRAIVIKKHNLSRPSNFSIGKKYNISFTHKHTENENKKGKKEDEVHQTYQLLMDQADKVQQALLTDSR